GRSASLPKQMTILNANSTHSVHLRTILATIHFAAMGVSAWVQVRPATLLHNLAIENQPAKISPFGHKNSSNQTFE
ncbi:MAG: hypothetical protein ACK56F_01485, partial [bacterium]